MPALVYRAAISSTILDLAPHRRDVEEACLRQEVQPLMMEHLPAADADAVEMSLALIDKADIYIGVFAHRYGHVPAGATKSITEMEYDHAVERGIPRLIFVMHEDHLIVRRDVDCENQDKLKAFLGRIDTVTARFKSPTDLRAHVIDALSHWLRGLKPEARS